MRHGRELLRVDVLVIAEEGSKIVKHILNRCQQADLWIRCRMVRA
jgi:hypothetical protein